MFTLYADKGTAGFGPLSFYSILSIPQNWGIIFLRGIRQFWRIVRPYEVFPNYRNNSFSLDFLVSADFSHFRNFGNDTSVKKYATCKFALT